MSKFLTTEQRADLKLDVFRLASQLVANDESLRAAAEGDTDTHGTSTYAARDTSSYAPPDTYGLRAAKVDLPSDGSAPKPYTKAIEARHAAEATPVQTSEQKYQKRRLAEFAAEYERRKR